MHDLLIRNALLVDGTGAAPRHGDLAVTDGRIAEIGRDLGRARETIDADGLALMPGIVDGHTHYDAQITWDPHADPSLTLGVTTIVIGNCGFTIAPCRPADRDLTMRNLTHVEGMSLDALRAGIDWGFESFPEYLSHLARKGVGPNVAAFFGHSSLRTFVMGAAAVERPATDAELAAMVQLTREAMASGAVGFATSTNEPHNGEHGIPMPSRLADQRELTTLVRTMGESGRGMFMLTKGSRTTIAELEAIAAASGRPVLIAAMFHSNLNPDGVFRQLDEMAAARRRGHRLIPQTSCCPLTMDFTLANPYPFEGLRAWHPAMAAKDGEELASIYRSQNFRAAVKHELDEFRGRRLFGGEWSRLTVVDARKPANRALEGRDLEAIARATGRHPLDVTLDLALEENLATGFTGELLHNDEQAVARLLRDPETHISLSDAGAHLAFMCDAGFGLHLLGHWSREREALALAEAVRRLTDQPCRLFGIADRGRLAPGFAADLLLFDPARVGRGPKRKVADLPTGAPRYTTDAIGLHGVWVNGERMLDESGVAPTHRRPGKVLRDFTA
jgi:N-acyl-D-aspartate/D-glutamate deacylase